MGKSTKPGQPYCLASHHEWVGRHYGLQLDEYAVLYEAPRVRAGERNVYLVSVHPNYWTALDELRRLQAAHRAVAA